MSNNTDIVIIGAGLSGIGAACHLKRNNPKKTYLILESRKEIGGTWSLFKYPGVRSDSDMYTFGYSFKTWDAPKSFADGASILKYLNEAIDEHDVRKRIRYNQKVVTANFDTIKANWTLITEHPETKKRSTYTAKIIFACSGYYNYSDGYTPNYKGLNQFRGIVVHPQKWPEDLNYECKKVVVIGSGATAVTIVPSMANKTAHITMLQRSPSYVGAMPNNDAIARFIKKTLPKKTAHKVIRLKNVTLDMMFFNACRKWPKTMRKFVIKNAKKILKDVPVEPHFSPNYNPWEQRFCLAPDGDLFKVIRDGKASVITDTIEAFTENGILLKSGKQLEADIIISATGLDLQIFGGAQLTVDNEVYDVTKKLMYKGLILSDLPNFIFFVGYTNASWTLKSDLTAEYANRLLKYMDKHSFDFFMPKVLDEDLKKVPLLNLNSGYINRAEDKLPKQGDKLPWKLYQNYFFDYYTLRIKSINDKRLKFVKIKEEV